MVVAGARTIGSADRAASTASSFDLLWIDDQPKVIASIVQQLRRRGCEVQVATTARLGLDALAHGHYDVVLLDYRMPDCSGFWVLEEAKTRGVTTPVIMLTGYATYSLGFEAGQHGARGILAKPVTADALLTAIRIVTGRAYGAVAGVEDPAWLLGAALFFDEMLEGIAQGRGELNPQRWQALLAKYLRVLTAPGITLLESRNGVRALKSLMAARRTLWPAKDALTTARQIATAEPTFTFGDLRSEVQIAVMRFETGGRDETQVLLRSFLRQIEVNRDPSHFGRHLAIGTGLSYEDWQSAARTRQAIGVLVHTFDPIGGIADACGWPSSQSMEREFAKLLGVPPSELRRMAHVV